MKRNDRAFYALSAAALGVVAAAFFADSLSLSRPWYSFILYKVGVCAAALLAWRISVRAPWAPVPAAVAGLACIVDLLGAGPIGVSYTLWKLALAAAVFVPWLASAGLPPRSKLKKAGRDAITDFRDWLRDHRPDLLIAGALFAAAVLVAMGYISAYESNNTGRTVSAVAAGPTIALGNYPHVPLVKILNALESILSALSRLLSPYALLHGLAGVLAFGIFRLGMGRFLSTLLSASLLVSSVQLDHLIPFWDKYYTRAPFTLALLLIMGLLVSRPFRPRRTLALAALGGAVLGQAIMFRLDLILLGLNVGLALTAFLPVPLRAELKLKTAALTLFALAVFLVYSSCPGCPLERKSNGHGLVSGSVPFFYTRLGVTNPQYDWGYLHLDGFTSAIAYAQEKILRPETRYEGLGPVDSQWRRIIRNFPADALIRAYAAPLKVLEVPFTYALHPSAVKSPFLRKLYAARAAPLDLLNGWGIWFTAAALLLMASQNLLLALFCLLLLPPLTAIVFGHALGHYFFHLEILGYWFLGFVLQRAVTFGASLRKRARRTELMKGAADPKRWWNPTIQRTFAFASGVLLILALPLHALRLYQSSRLEKTLRIYDDAELDRLNISKRIIKGRRVLVGDPAVLRPQTGVGFDAMELMAEFDGKRCGRKTVWLTLRYAGASDPYLDFSRSMTVELESAEKTRLFFPAMSHQGVLAPNWSGHFAGIELAAEHSSCLSGLYRVKNPERLPMLLTLKMPLPKTDRYREIDDDRLRSSPPGLPRTEALAALSARLAPISDSDIEFHDPIVTIESSPDAAHTTWKVHGHAADNSRLNPLFPVEGPRWEIARSAYVDHNGLLVDTDLLITKPKRRRKGAAFVAHGKLRSGGVMFVLLERGRPAGKVIVANPGPFEVVLQAPRDGVYQVGMTNFLAYYNTMENRLSARVGWTEQ